MPISFARVLIAVCSNALNQHTKAMQIASQKSVQPGGESLSGNCWVIRLSDFSSRPPLQSDFLRKLLRGWHKSTHDDFTARSFFEVSVKNELRWQHRKNPSSVIWKMIWIPVILASARPHSGSGNFQALTMMYNFCDMIMTLSFDLFVYPPLQQRPACRMLEFSESVALLKF